jgi:predicted DNA-binding transcriptional regulator AlpA
MSSTSISSATPSLKVVVSLDDLASQPDRACALGADDARRLFSRAMVTVAALSAALQNDQQRAPFREGSGLLRVDDVAQRIGMSRSWVQKHTRDLPPRVRVGGEARWREGDIDAWIRTRPRWEDP